MRKDITQDLHNLYDAIAQLHQDIKNCADISNDERKDLIDSNYELEEIVRCMINELESVTE